MPVYAYGIKRNPLFWQGNKIGKAYRYGTLVFQSAQWSQSSFTNLATGRYLAPAAAVPNGNVILIAGGTTNESDFLSTVEMYTEAGVRSTVNSLGRSKRDFAGYGYADKAFFAGGGYSSLSNTSDADMYNSAGVRTSISALRNPLRGNQAAEAGGYVLFAAGRRSALNGQYATVDAYNQSGARTSLSDLMYETMYLAGASCNGYAIFGFGIDGTSYPKGITVFNPSLVRSSTLSGTEKRDRPTATKCGDGVIFAGGRYRLTSYGQYYMVSAVEHVTTAGVHTTLTSLTTACYGPQSGTLNGMAVIAGGRESATGAGITALNIYDSNKVKIASPFSLVTGRSHSAYATLNNSLYMCGGLSNSTNTNTVEVISYK